MIRNKNIKDDLEAIEYTLKTHGFYALHKPIKCIEEYIEKLERENFGLKVSVKNKQETLEKLGGYLKK